MNNQSPLNLPLKLARLTSAFYMPSDRYNPSVRSIVKVLDRARDCVVNATQSGADELTTLVAGDIAQLMRQIHGGSGAEGRWVVSDMREEALLIQRFAFVFVHELYLERLRGDRSALKSERGYGLIQTGYQFLIREQMSRNKYTASEPRLPQIQDWEVERDGDTVLLCGPGSLEIEISDAKPERLEYQQLEGCSDPEVSGYSIELEEGVTLQVVILESSTEDFPQCKLHIGNSASWVIPWEVALELKRAISIGG